MGSTLPRPWAQRAPRQQKQAASLSFRQHRWNPSLAFRKICPNVTLPSPWAEAQIGIGCACRRAGMSFAQSEELFERLLQLWQTDSLGPEPQLALFDLVEVWLLRCSERPGQAPHAVWNGRRWQPPRHPTQMPPLTCRGCWHLQPRQLCHGWTGVSRTIGTVGGKGGKGFFLGSVQHGLMRIAKRQATPSSLRCFQQR
jgi:hypothetical protein